MQKYNYCHGEGFSCLAYYYTRLKAATNINNNSRSKLQRRQTICKLKLTVNLTLIGKRNLMIKGCQKFC